MADKYIINMPEKVTPADTDLTMVEDAQDTKRMTWANFVKPLKDLIGNMASLTTTHKSTIVGAINEVLGKIGNLASLSTTHKDTVVGAINELLGKIGNLTNLSTTHKDTVVGAINEMHANDNFTPTRHPITLVNEVTGLDDIHLVKSGKTIFFRGLMVASATGPTHVVARIDGACRVSVVENTIALDIDRGTTHRVLLSPTGWVTIYNTIQGGRYKLMPYSLEG